MKGCGDGCTLRTEGSHSHVCLHRLGTYSVKPMSGIFYPSGVGRQAIGKEGVYFPL